MNENVVTVEDLLEMPSLSGIKLLAGRNGLRRKIASVTVVDTPDGSAWLRGEELVLTTAFAVKNDKRLLTELVYQLHKKNAAGLGVKSGRFIDEIPRDALAAADLLGFPIISVPEKYAFRDIINPVIAAVVDRQSARLIYSEKIHNEFLRLAVNVDSDEDVLSARGSLRGRSEGGPVRDNDMITAALEYAATVLALRMMDRVASQRIEDKYRDVFLEDLLTNNVKTETEIHSRARLYGWDFHNGGLVVIVDINNIKKFYVTGFDLEKDSKLQEASRGIFDVSISQMLAVFPGAKCYKQSDLAVFIVSPEKYEQNKIYAQLEGVFDAIRSRIAGKMIFTVTMGVGEYFPNIRDIHKSYRQARTSINLGYQIEKFDCILFYSRMGIYRLLSSIAGTDEAREFIERYVRPLADYDAKYNASLTETLEAIIKCGWNLKMASELLLVHYNSVKYRFSKICELLEADLRDHEERLAVDIALKLNMMNDNNWQ